MWVKRLENTFPRQQTCNQIGTEKPEAHHPSLLGRYSGAKRGLKFTSAYQKRIKKRIERNASHLLLPVEKKKTNGEDSVLAWVRTKAAGQRQ